MIKIVILTAGLIAVMTGFVTVSQAEHQIEKIAPPGMIFEVLALNHDLPTRKWPKYRSPVALTPSNDGRWLYVAEQTAKRIAVVDLIKKKVIKTISLPEEVTGIAVAPGGMLYVTCASEWRPGGMVCEVDAVTAKVVRRLPAGSGVCAPVVSPDGTILYVCNRYSDDVYFIDIAEGALLKKLYVCREPLSCALTPDGSTLIVVNSIPMQNAVDDSAIASKVLLINTAERSVDTAISLPAGSHSVIDVAVGFNGKYAYVTHLVGMSALTTTTIEGGWIHTNNLAVVDLTTKLLLNDFPLDDAVHGAANPWKIACTDDNRILCVVHAGTDEMTVIDLQKMMDVAKEKHEMTTMEKGLRFIGCTHDFTALSQCKHRVPVRGLSPRALAIIGSRAYTAGYFPDSTGFEYLEIFDLPSGNTTTRPAGTITLGPSSPMNGMKKGEYAFINGALCHQEWQSCFSCHPFARADGLNWTFINSAPRNAKSMVYSWWTPRTGWTGRRGHARESVRLGFRNSLFVPTDDEISSYIDTFLMYIKPVPSPYLNKGTLSQEADAGRNVFYENSSCDCIFCHTGPLFTDLRYHGSGIPLKWDVYSYWDTPSLPEAWRSAPYDHIGSFDRLEDLLRYQPHSRTLENGLSEQEFRNLIQYILSL